MASVQHHATNQQGELPEMLPKIITYFGVLQYSPDNIDNTFWI